MIVIRNAWCLGEEIIEAEIADYPSQMVVRGSI